MIGVGGLGRLPDTTAGEALVVRAVLEIRTSSCAKAAVWRLRFATPLESGSEARPAKRVDRVQLLRPEASSEARRSETCASSISVSMSPPSSFPSPAGCASRISCQLCMLRRGKPRRTWSLSAWHPYISRCNDAAVASSSVAQGRSACCRPTANWRRPEESRRPR